MESLVVGKVSRVSAWESVAPYCVRGSSVLMGGSFSRRPQPKLIVFMSPQRELGGAQSLAGNPKRFNIFGYCWILFSGTAFCLLTHQLALVARVAGAVRFSCVTPFLLFPNPTL
jgi:hypothetical protein